MPPLFYFVSASASGSPVAIDVRIDNTPANAPVLATVIQLTSPSVRHPPIVAIAACATVLTALIAAAFQKSFVLLNPPFFNGQCLFICISSIIISPK